MPLLKARNDTIQKENQDSELHEIALREFGKDYNDLNEKQKHQCAGFKGSAHRAVNAAAHAHAVGESVEGTYEVTYAPAASHSPDDPEREKFSIETFGKSYANLDAHQKHQVASMKGASHRAGGHSPHVA